MIDKKVVLLFVTLMLCNDCNSRSKSAEQKSVKTAIQKLKTIFEENTPLLFETS